MRSALSLAGFLSASLLLGPVASGISAHQSPERRPTEPALTLESIKIEAEDGVRLAATLRRGRPTDPAVLLLHQCDGDRSMYDRLSGELAARSIQTLAIDFRGLGESASLDLDLLNRPSREAWARAESGFPLDVTAALRRLDELSAGSPRAIVGASCGGREAVHAATQSPAIKALVLLSARLGSESLDLLARNPEYPLLLIAARGDRGAHRAAETAAGANRHPATKLKPYPGEHHGAPLFEAHRGLEAEIADWLAAILASS